MSIYGGQGAKGDRGDPGPVGPAGAEGVGLAGAFQRRLVVLAVFVVFCMVILGFVYQLQVRYTKAQCENRVQTLTSYKRTWGDLEAAERRSTQGDPALRDERIAIYQRAQQVATPVC